jgi:hypothetical protein
MKKGIEFIILGLAAMVMISFSYFANPTSQAKVSPTSVPQGFQQVPAIPHSKHQGQKTKDERQTKNDNCSPAYPDVCIPLVPPDLDCGDITERRFKVLSADPHGFDGNNDGVGCQSD